MHVRTYATLRDLLGTSQITLELVEPTPAREVLRRLVTAYPVLNGKLWDAGEKLTGYVMVLVNGRSLDFLDGLDTIIAPNDNLSLFPPVGGG
jgi:molybdopterin synthase sulfur carrier subunit